MRKIVVGIIAVALVAIGGYFSAASWGQGLVENDVEALFDAMRGSGVTATHGAIKSDVLTRSVVVEDVVIEFNGSTRLSAPKIEVAGFSAPPGPVRKADGASTIAVIRAVLDATSASSIDIPSLTVSLRLPMPVDPLKPAADVEISYSWSGTALRELRDRRIGSVTVERVGFSVSGPPDLGKFGGEFTQWTIADIDLDALLAVFDPAESGSAGPFRRVYGPITAGASKMEFDKGGRLQIDSMSGDGFDIQPSKYNVGRLMAVIEAAKGPDGSPSPAQAALLIDQLAATYDGIRWARMELRGASFVPPPGGEIKFAAIRMHDFENGRLGEFTIEGVDARTPGDNPFTVDRFSLTGLHFSNFMRLAGQLAGGRLPDQGPLSLLEGISLNGMKVSVRQAREPVVIDNFDVSWGQYVGPVPTKTGLKLKFSSPIIANGNEEGIKVLAAAGVTSVAVNFNYEAGWTESSKTFAITPISLDIANWFSANAAASVGNVPRDVFIIDPSYSAKIPPLVMGLELGPVEFVLRDTGGLDVLLAILAQQQGVSPADARNTLVLGLSAAAEPVLAGHPEFKPMVDAATKFLETSKGTFSLKVVPNGKVTVAQVAAAAQANPADPLAALASFKIDAGNR